MFYIVHSVPDNVFLQWQDDQSVGVQFPTADEYRLRYARDKKIDPATIAVIRLEDSQAPATRPDLNATLIDPATLQFSPNPNYVPPAPVEPPPAQG